MRTEKEKKPEIQERKFYQTVAAIALPVTLQSLLQSSFGVVDQVMTGQLGSVSIAGIGLSSKFSSVFSTLVSAVGAVAGIMIAQYMGKREREQVRRSFFVNLILAMTLAAAFTGLCQCCSTGIMGLYSRESRTVKAAAGYLRLAAWSYLPMAAGLLFSTLLRCMEAARLPLYASVLGALLNTGLNYILIFGKWGFPALGAEGAAVATVISQMVSCLVTVRLFVRYCRSHSVSWLSADGEEKREGGAGRLRLSWDPRERKQYGAMLLPILLCEFLWTLGENVYAAIYGHMGTGACAAMTLTLPIQVLVMGAMSGVSQAAGVITGKTLGRGRYDQAYEEAKKLMLYGLAGAAALSVILVIGGRYYVKIYQVEETVRETARQILTAFAVIAPVKVQNMILGGGIIRSGGKTNYIMWIDFIGTWMFGVPLGLMASLVWKLEIPLVYFLLSTEECVRLLLSLWVFRRKRWMRSL